MTDEYEQGTHIDPEKPTQRLVRGERLFYPGALHHSPFGSLNTHIRRTYGLYVHLRLHEDGGERGMLVWADDEPPPQRTAQRKAFRSLGPQE